LFITIEWCREWIGRAPLSTLSMRAAACSPRCCIYLCCSLPAAQHPGERPFPLALPSEAVCTISVRSAADHPAHPENLNLIFNFTVAGFKIRGGRLLCLGPGPHRHQPLAASSHPQACFADTCICDISNSLLPMPARAIQGGVFRRRPTAGLPPARPTW